MDGLSHYRRRHSVWTIIAGDPLTTARCHWQRAITRPDYAPLSYYKRCAASLCNFAALLAAVFVKQNQLIKHATRGQHSIIFTNRTILHTVSKKTGPLRLIWHNFTNAQHLLIIFGAERPYSILNSLSQKVFKLASNQLRDSIATVATWRSVSQKTDPTIFWHNSIKSSLI